MITIIEKIGYKKLSKKVKYSLKKRQILCNAFKTKKHRDNRHLWC